MKTPPKDAKPVPPLHQRAAKTARQFACFATMTLAMSTGSHAQNIISDVGASERINVAGQLGTLSQRAIGAACNLNAGVSVRESKAILQISTDQFSRITDALLYGNRSFGILGEEGRPKTLRLIENLNSVWSPLIEQARSTTVDESDRIKSLAEQSEPLMDVANLLVTEITGQYADPVALLHADALLIDLAGRQRILAASMSKDMCLIASGITVDTAKADLQEASELFSDTLTALRNGMPSVGVRPPPTEKISDGLQFVVEEWEAIQPFIARAMAGETLDAAERQRVYFAFLGIESRMNNVVTSYDQNSKLGL